MKYRNKFVEIEFTVDVEKNEEKGLIIVRGDIIMEFNCVLDVINDLGMGMLSSGHLIEVEDYELQAVKEDIRLVTNVFIEAHSSAQSIETLYEYALKSLNTPTTKASVNRSRYYSGCRYQCVLILAYMTKSPNYKQIKEKLLAEWLAFKVKEYEDKVFKHNKKQQELSEMDKNHKVIPYCALIDGSVEEVMNARILKWVKKLETYNPDEMIDEDYY